MISIGGTKFELGMRDLKKKVLKARRQIIGKTVMTGIAEQGLTIIQKRTQVGKDLLGRRFTKYTDAYRKRRLKKGRSGTRVDLTFSGRMLGAMQSKFIRAGKAVINFSRAEEAAKAGGNERKRQFFGVVSKSEIDALIKEGNRLIDKEIKRLGLT